MNRRDARTSRDNSSTQEIRSFRFFRIIAEIPYRSRRSLHRTFPFCLLDFAISSTGKIRSFDRLELSSKFRIYGRNILFFLLDFTEISTDEVRLILYDYSFNLHIVRGISITLSKVFFSSTRSCKSFPKNDMYLYCSISIYWIDFKIL